MLSHFNTSWINRLLHSPLKQITGQYNGIEYTASILIPEYKSIVAEHYKEILKTDIDLYCTQAEIPHIYEHYGVNIEFSNAIQIDIQDNQQVLDNGLKQVLNKAGPIIIKNAYLSSAFRGVDQRNSFPHLNFHIDRNINMPTRFSVYTRDPFDEEQKHPRKSSTLFMASIVGYLQGVKEGIVDPHKTRGINQSFEIFRDTQEIKDLIGRIMIEHRWDQPESTGEISMLDNATELHSSYERTYKLKGYRIGVRYLA